MIRKSGSGRRSLVRSPYRTSSSRTCSRAWRGAAPLIRSFTVTPVTSSSGFQLVRDLAQAGPHPAAGERGQASGGQGGEGAGQSGQGPAAGQDADQGGSAGGRGDGDGGPRQGAGDQRFPQGAAGEDRGQQVLADDAERPGHGGAEGAVPRDQRDAGRDV